MLESAVLPEGFFGPLTSANKSVNVPPRSIEKASVRPMVGGMPPPWLCTEVPYRLNTVCLLQT